MPPVDPFILIPKRTKDLRTCVRRLWLTGVDITSNVQQSTWWNWSPWPHAVTSDGAGGMYVLVGGAWTDSQRLELHHVDASGVKSGSATLEPGAAFVIRLHYSAKLISSTGGSCIVVWNTFAGPGDYSPLVAQRFDRQCNAVWPAPVEVVGPGFFSALAAAEDGAGGAVLAVLKSNTLPATPEFRVQRVTAAGNLQWGPSGNQGPAPGPIFAAAFHAPRIFSVGNGYAFLWLSNSTTLMAAWLGAGGQVTGAPFSIGAVGEGWWEMAGVRRAVADDNNGFWVAAAPLAPGQQLRLLRFGPGATVPTVTAMSRNLAAPYTYALAPDGAGGVFVVTADPAGVVGVDHFDYAGNQLWANTAAARFTTIPIAQQLFPGALNGDHFPARLLSVATRGSAGIVVSYEDWQNSAAPRLRFRCFDRFGASMGPASEISPGLGAQSSALFIQPGLPNAPAQLSFNEDVNERAPTVNCAWLTKASASTRTISAQKLGCCAEVYDVDRVPNPWLRNRCAIPIDFPPAIPGTINVSFPCSRKSLGNFGLLPLPLLARVPGLTLPGSLASKNVPPPDWVRIQFGGVPDDVEIAIYAHTGERIGRAKHLLRDVRNSTTRELTFKPKPQLSYVLAFTRKPGDESSPGFIPIGVAATFGAGRPPKRLKLDQ